MSEASRKRERERAAKYESAGIREAMVTHWEMRNGRALATDSTYILAGDFKEGDILPAPVVTEKEVDANWSTDNSEKPRMQNHGGNQSTEESSPVDAGNKQPQRRPQSCIFVLPKRKRKISPSAVTPNRSPNGTEGS